METSETWEDIGSAQKQSLNFWPRQGFQERKRKEDPTHSFNLHVVRQERDQVKKRGENFETEINFPEAGRYTLC